MRRELKIESLNLSDDSDCFVIAEIGNNHQGDLEKAMDMFKAAKECGVDAVKLQKRDNRSLLTKAAYDRPYDNENSFGGTYGEHREALEFGRHEYEELKKYAQELGLVMFSTAFDMRSADFLAELDMPLYKIASGDLKNTPLLRHVAKIGRPMIISTGGGTMEDVQRAYDAIMPINNQLAILQCTASYPAEPEDLNLKVISTYREKFPDVIIGLSDHENGIAMAVAAYVLGSRMVEQHFTLNHTWKGTDHAFSLEPIGMKKLVRDLRRVKVAMGDGEKKIYPSEVDPIRKMGKKLVAARGLKSGQMLTREDIAIKSPSDGIPPYELENVIGKTLTKDLLEDENIAFENLK